MNDADINVVVDGNRDEIFTDDGWDHFRYEITVTVYGESMSFPFKTGTGWDKAPSRIEILHSLAHDLDDADLYGIAELVDDLGYTGADAVRVRKTLDEREADAKRVLGNDLPWFITTYRDEE